MVELMSRLMPLLGFAIASGCGLSGDAATQVPAPSEQVVESSPKARPFRLDEKKQIIYLDTQIAPGQRRRFDIGLGSITIQTMQVKDKKLTFLYTPEVEGGYATYECTVPVSSKPIEFKIDSDGTPGKTSFDLTKCKIVKRGNLLMDK
jgi:hypothetical protein